MNTRKASKGRDTRTPSSPPSTAADLARACIMPIERPDIPKFPVGANKEQAKSWARDVCNKLSIMRSHRRVLIELAIHARKEGIAWPSIKTLSEETGDSERTISYATKQLEALGLFVRDHGGGKKITTKYHFVGLPPSSQSLSEVREGQSCPRCTNGTMQNIKGSLCCNLCRFDGSLDKL